jgi:hypothetical protein
VEISDTSGRCYGKQSKLHCHPEPEGEGSHPRKLLEGKILRSVFIAFHVILLALSREEM